ncbi:MAG TPA: tetratricopeptide repeat protein, partial [Myxococcota bacterium]|nr:tetratricopeptide repeat protein [Myxococcota bacterium]
DPAAAAGLGEIAAKAGGTASSLEQVGSDSGGLDLDLDVEVDLDLDQAIDEVAASETQSDIRLGSDADETDGTFELDLDLDLDADLAQGDAASTPTAGTDEDGGSPASAAGRAAGALEAETTSPSVDEEDVFELDLDGEGLDVDLSEAFDESSGETPQDDPADSGDPTTEEVAIELELDPDTLELSASGSNVEESPSLTIDCEEELEEADFYLAQDMHDEAEAILARILASQPEHAIARARMETLRAARAASGEPAPSPTAAPSAPTLSGDAVATEAGESTARLSGETHASVAATGVEPGESEEGDPTEESLVGGLSGASDEESIAFEIDLDDEDAAIDLAEPEPEPEPEAEDTFDLREALADVLADDEEPRADESPSGVLSTVEDGFESIFSDFKKGVSATLEEGDYDTRYDLGIAYREMGLFEDAIGEFRVCLDSEARRFDSLYLMGLCARDLARFDDAVNHLEQALALPEIPSARLAGVYFDLSVAQEGAGDQARAVSSLERVLAIDARFPGAAERLTSLRRGVAETPELGSPGEGLESFADLFDDDDDEAGDQALVEAVPMATVHSSEDSLPDPPDAPDVSEASEAFENDAGSIPADDTRSRRKGGRKKISFV